MAHPQRDSDPWRTPVEAEEKGDKERAAETSHHALATTPFLPIASLKGLSVTCGDKEAGRRRTCSGRVKLSLGVKLRQLTPTERGRKGVFPICVNACFFSCLFLYPNILISNQIFILIDDK